MLKAILVLLVLVILLAGAACLAIYFKPDWRMKVVSLLDETEGVKPDQASQTPAPTQTPVVERLPIYAKQDLAEIIADTSAEVWKEMSDQLVLRTKELENFREENTRLKIELDQRQTQLQQERQDMIVLQEQVDKQIVELEKLRDSLLSQKDAQDATYRAKLAKIIPKMDAQQASAMLLGLDLAEAVQVLAGMKESAAGEILTVMAKDKEPQAQAIVKEFTERVKMPTPLNASGSPKPAPTKASGW